MPRPKVYPTRAAQQAAYRQRQQQATGTAAAAGCPSRDWAALAAEATRLHERAQALRGGDVAGQLALLRSITALLGALTTPVSSVRPQGGQE